MTSNAFPPEIGGTITISFPFGEAERVAATVTIYLSQRTQPPTKVLPGDGSPEGSFFLTGPKTPDPEDQWYAILSIDCGEQGYSPAGYWWELQCWDCPPGYPLARKRTYDDVIGTAIEFHAGASISGFNSSLSVPDPAERR